MKKNKITSCENAARLINDRATIVTGGFVGIGFAEEMAIELENRYLRTGSPKDLTLVFAAGQGDGGSRGANHFGHPGMLKRVIGGHWGLLPKLQKLAIQNRIQAYNLPLGVLSQMFRDIAAHRPRTITHVGLDTFVDPRNGGGKLNISTKEDIIELVLFDGKEYLAYKTIPIDIALLRGTTADLSGNITMEKEALILDSLAIAMAAKNSGGLVIVQVERIAQKNTLDSRKVIIPSILVDKIVVSKPQNHHQTFQEVYNPAFSGEIRVPVESVSSLEMGAEKIIARRAAFELGRGNIVNLGFGIPALLSDIAIEERFSDLITLTAEPGVVGGLPAAGLNFGAAVNTEAIVDMPAQFDFYNGKGIDVAFLGLAQIDKEGNLNVSKFGDRLAGAGGFIDISQNAKKVVFVGKFKAKGLKVSINKGKLKIDREGQINKIIKQVEHVTFNGKRSFLSGQEVLYITERCVFILSENGLELTEIAPGIDLEKDILCHIDFELPVKKPLTLMDKRIFEQKPMRCNSGVREFSLKHQ